MKGKFFYRINILLGFVLILFAATILISNLNKVHSQDGDSQQDIYTALGITRQSDNVTILNKELPVSFEKNNFNIPFESDGINDGASPERRAMFNEGSNLKRIPIPLSITINQSRTKLITPGIPQYKVVKSPTAPLSLVCKESTEDAEKECLNAVISARVLSEISSRKYIINKKDLETEVVPDETGVFVRFLNALIAPANTPDQGRTAIGTISFWGEDELNQVLGVLDNKIRVDSAAVYKDIDFSVQELSPAQPPYISDKVCDNLTKSTKEDKNNLPISSICDPYTPTPKEDANNFTFTQIIKYILTRNTNDYGNQQKISVPIPVRKIARASSMNVAYRFCDAVGNTWPSEYPNKFDPNEKICETTKDATGKDITTCRPDPNSKWSRYNALQPSVRKCIQAIKDYRADQGTAADATALHCAEVAATSNGSASCEEMTVEEDDLKYGQLNEDVPISMEAHLQNAVLNYIDPKPGIPQKNYLAPDYCARLEIGYDLSDPSGYIYRIGGGENGTTQNFTNQYCVIGAILSNPAKVMLDQQAAYSTDPKEFGYINESKTALTCDKKEIGIFGANFTDTDNASPSGKLVYQVRDNGGLTKVGGHGNLNSNDTMFYHGSDFYKLDEILSEIHRMDLNNPEAELSDPGAPRNDVAFKRYGDWDIRAISGDTDKPQYMLGVTQKTTEQTNVNGNYDNNPRNLVLCKLNSELQQGNSTKDTASNVKPPRLCKVIDSSPLVSLTGKAILSKVEINGTTRDVVTIVRRTYTSNFDYKLVYDQVVINTANIEKSEVIKRNVVIFDRAVDFDIKLMSGGRVGVLMGMSVSIIDPRKSDNQIVTKIDDLCSGTNVDNCKYMSQFPVSSVLMYDNVKGALYVVATGGNLGMVFGVPSDSGTPPTSLFAFNKKGESKPDEESDKLSKITQEELKKLEEANNESVKAALEEKIDASSTLVTRVTTATVDPATGEFLVFISSKYTSYMLRLKDPSLLLQDPIASRNFVNKISGGSGSLVGLQKEFNPANFKWDCSNYDGVKPGLCGFESLGEIGRPVVMEAQVQPDGRIKAWYKYSGIRDNAIFYSADYEYSLRGVYEKVADKNSNFYVASNQDPGNPVKALPYFGYIDAVTIRSDREKNDCMDLLETKVTDDDKFYHIPGVQKVNLAKRDTKKAEDESKTSFNSGNYCEETQCIPDSFNMAENAKFDTTNPANVEAVKKSIKNFFATVYRKNPSKVAADNQAIDIVCEEAAIKGIHCGILVAIWIKESSANPTLSGYENFECYDTNYTKAQRSNLRFQAGCAAGTVTSKYKNFKVGITLEGPGSVGTPNSSCQPVKGSCVAGTKFSYIFQQYTPADARINFNNQCNKGVVVRPDQDAADIKCNNSHQPTVGSEVCSNTFEAGAASTSRKWPREKATETNPNLFNTLRRINEVIEKDGNSALIIDTTDKCYPGSTSGDNSNTSDNRTIEDIRNNYDVTSSVGTFKMDLGAWGTSWAAGNVRMALDYNIRTGEEGRGLMKTHMIQPGSKFSYNSIIGDPEGQHFNALKGNYEKKGYSFSGERIPGGGLCELATTIRVAASRVKTLDSSGNVSNIPRFNVTQFSGRPIGTGRGYEGDIYNNQHSDVSLDTFNSSLAVEGDKLTDLLMYTSIVTDYPDENDGNLVIYNKSSDETLFILVTEESQGIIRVDVFFGKAKAGGSKPDLSSNSSAIESMVNGSGGKVTSKFNEARDGGLRSHEGVDIMAPEGTPVRALVAGKVTYSQWNDVGGWSVQYTDKTGRNQYFTHLKEASKLRKGDDVSPGMILGYVGTSGNADGKDPHLHWQLSNKSQQWVDPEKELSILLQEIK